MSYTLGGRLDGASIRPGTNVLVTGPPLTGKRRLGREILRHGMAAGEGSIVISTHDSAERVEEVFAAANGTDDDLLGIVDCVTRHVGRSPTDTDRVRYASSPTDMTGIGIKFAESIEYFQCEHGVEHNRVLLNSVTTLLQYTSLQTVFRFLHALTTRIEEVDAIGVAIVESTVHDEEAMGTIRELFDGVVETDLDGSLSVDLPATDGDDGIRGS
ncbi:KaiC protein [Halomicrobium zhouii]|uniref:KaiC protein n=1 Tax=Halomicrobium zhouii TaxID=767519 RepID=A0A1I6LZT8_9EURY|nr:ATPase domain-containing protein [Halomicrobium zhouii]SFS08762.1 KaiC protein [Halomicrobium zhouii]